MKHMLYLTLVSLFFACGKSDSFRKNDSLTGRWKLTTTAYSIGGPMIEEQVSGPKSEVIEFKPNGVFTSTRANVPYDRYTVDSANHTVTLTGGGAAPTTARFDISGGTLKLSQVDPICIEGCYAKYVTAP